MPAETRASIFLAGDGYGIRWPENGKRPQQTGFRTKREARDWFDENVAPRLRGRTRRRHHVRRVLRAVPRTPRRDRERPDEGDARGTARARARRFGTWKLSELEGAADDIARWRAGLADSSRYRFTLALRQALGAAKRWRYIARNPAVDAGRNPEPRAEELRPFTPEEVDALAVELGPVYGQLVVFAAETGLRTNEWVALERRDIDRSGPRRSSCNGASPMGR